VIRNDVVELILQKVREKDFDEYRKYYDSFSFDELKYINNEICKMYSKTTQADFNFNMFVDIFEIASNYFKRSIRIIELGPHQGYLAKKMLEKYGDYIESWIGYDIASYTIENSVVTDSKYSVIEINDYFHNIDLPEFDLFCSTHTFEHLNRKEIELCVDHVKSCTFMAIEVPRTDMMEDSWQGYCGTHVLVIPKKEFISIFNKAGFRLFYDGGYSVNWWVSGWVKEGIEL